MKTNCIAYLFKREEKTPVPEKLEILCDRDSCFFRESREECSSKEYGKCNLYNRAINVSKYDSHGMYSSEAEK